MRRRRPWTLVGLGTLVALVVPLHAQVDDPSPCILLWQEAPVPSTDRLEEPVQQHLAETREATLAVLQEPESPSSESARAVASLAVTYQAYGLTKAADALYGVARCLDPHDPAWPYAEARIAEKAGDLERAESLYFDALGPTSPYPVRFRMAELARMRGDETRAEMLYRQALEEPSSRAAALAALGQLALARGDYEAAVRFLEAALELVPEADLLHYPLSLAYRRLGDAEAAQRHLAARGPVGVTPADPLDRLLREIPRGARVLLLRGRAALRAGRLDEAVAALSEAVQQDPGNTSARIALAVAAFRVGDRERAREELDAVLEIAPENSTALFNRAVLAMEDGDKDRARDLLERARKLNPDDEEIGALLKKLAPGPS